MTLPEIIESKIDRHGDGCWRWVGVINADGYGHANHAGKTHMAHRLVYQMMVGEIDKPQLDHLCRNKACVNPDHLEPVTAAENKRRQRATVSHCKRGHEYTQENCTINSKGWRICMVCKREINGRENVRAAKRRWEKENRERINRRRRERYAAKVRGGVTASAILALVGAVQVAHAAEPLDLTPHIEAMGCGEWTEGYRSSAETRKATRERMRRTWRAMGADREAVRVLDAIVVRESTGDPCARHLLGKSAGENGYGPGGLFWRVHRGKWHRDPATADPRSFFVPEITAVVMLRIFRRAVRRHDAQTWVEIGEVFATGKIRDDGSRVVARHNFAHRLRRRGIDPEAKPGRLGTKLGLSPTDDQDEFVRGLLEGG